MILLQQPLSINSIFNWTQLWSILGVIISIAGLGYTIFQVRKIASETETINKTYTEAINVIRANELISSISIALEKVKSVRQGFVEQNLFKRIDEIAELGKSLNSIKGSFQSEKDVFEKYIKFTSDLFTDVFLKKIEYENEKIKGHIEIILEIENYLVSVQGNVKLKSSK